MSYGRVYHCSVCLLILHRMIDGAKLYKYLIQNIIQPQNNSKYKIEMHNVWIRKKEEETHHRAISK